MKFENKLPASALILGLCCAAVRWLLFQNHMDARGLLTPGTALEWCTYLLTVGSLIFFLLANRGFQAEPIPKLCALGELAGGFGIALAALTHTGAMVGLLGMLWKLLGLAAGLCLMGQAVCSWMRKKGSFALYLVPCIFFLLHLIDHYRGWSAQPQLQTYLFDLLAVLSLTFLCYYRAAAQVGLGGPRMETFAGLSATFSCLAAIPGGSEFALMYAMCLPLAVTGLCRKAKCV